MTRLGLAPGRVQLVDHDSGWADDFAAEARRLAPIFAPGDLHHIGSSAVPGLIAKPILDLGATAPLGEQAGIAAQLIGLGYIDRHERSGWLFIRVDDRGWRTHNLHLYPPGDPRLVDQLAFRDALRADPDLRDGYGALKRRLAGDPALSRADYTDGKGPFIHAAKGR